MFQSLVSYKHKGNSILYGSLYAYFYTQHGKILKQLPQRKAAVIKKK